MTTDITMETHLLKERVSLGHSCLPSFSIWGAHTHTHTHRIWTATLEIHVVHVLYSHHSKTYECTFFQSIYNICSLQWFNSQQMYNPLPRIYIEVNTLLSPSSLPTYLRVCGALDDFRVPEFLLILGGIPDEVLVPENCPN